MHGGQHRLANIVEALVAAGHDIESTGVLGSVEYGNLPNFCPYPGATPLTRYLDNPFLMDDWAIGELFHKDDQFYQSLASKISAVPDLIFIEQPWLFRFAERYVHEEKLKNTVLVYGSQNIESDLKHGILLKYTNQKNAAFGKKLVLETELNAMKRADGISCVSTKDLEWTQARTSTKCIVAQNGVKDRRSTRVGLEEANRISQHRKFALLCASAHPPNISGFYDIFGNGLGCVAPDELIVIAGGAGNGITSDVRFNKTAGLNRAVVSAGVVSEECIASLLEIAHTIILPITQGSGTNLKTAEAIWAGKHIVATPIAMRGFEQFSNISGLSIANEPREFLAATRNAMSSPPLRLNAGEREARATVLWKSTLQDLVSMISDFESSRTNHRKFA